MTLLGFTGYSQSGKDTAAGFLVERGLQRLAFADILRQSLYNLNPIIEMPLEDAPDHWARVQDLVDWKGWDVVKVEYPEIRQLLQRMGTEVGRELYGENFWVDRVMAQVNPHKDYVITDVRFPNESSAVFLAGGRVIRIVRQGLGAVNTHVSDTGVDKLTIDGTILNNGSLEDFGLQVIALLD
jgi:hypothetical protein